MALSQETSLGIGYYAPNDVTSWLNGFNVVVNKIDEILVGMQDITEDNRNTLQSAIDTINGQINSIQSSNGIQDSNILALQTAMTNINNTIGNVNNSINTLNDNLSKLVYTKIGDIYYQLKTDNYQEINFRASSSSTLTSSFSNSTGLHFTTYSFVLPAELSLINYTHYNINVGYEGSGIFIVHPSNFNDVTKTLAIYISRPTAFTNEIATFNVTMKFFK